MDDVSNTRVHNGADAQKHWNEFAAQRKVEQPEEVASLGLYGSSPVYDGYRARAEEKMIRAILPEIKPHWRVLDLGCGPGRWTVPLAKICAQVTAVDFSEAMLTITRKRCDLAGVGAKLETHQKRIEDISCRELNGPFDLVLAMGVLQYVHEVSIENTVARLVECIAPGGLLIHREIRSPKSFERVYRDDAGREVMRSFYKPFEKYRQSFEAHQLKLVAQRSIIPPSLAYSVYSRLTRRKEGVPEGAILKLIIAAHEKIIDPLWYLFPKLLWTVNSRRETDQAVALYQK